MRFGTIGAVAIFVATAVNALFFQEKRRSAVSGPNTSIAVVELQPSQPALPARVAPPLPAKPPPQGLDPVSIGVPAAPRLQAAIQRELVRKGYLHLPPLPLRYAIAAYEYDCGAPLTGEASDALLRRLIFDLDPAPKGALADRAETDRPFVLEMQKTLLELGFFSGALSGRMDVWTADAIKDFERHRSIPLTGRLTEATLLELVAYSGQPLRKTIR